MKELPETLNRDPYPRVERIVGILDSLTMSTRTAVLKLNDGFSLRGNIAKSIDLALIRSLLGSEVVVEGSVSFRTSARPQRIEIDHVAAATHRDQIWKSIPKGKAGQQLTLPADLSSYFGQWPGEEDDDQVFASLKELA